MRDGGDDLRRCGVLLLLLLLLLGGGHTYETVLETSVAIALAFSSLSFCSLFTLMSLAGGLILSRALS